MGKGCSSSPALVAGSEEKAPFPQAQVRQLNVFPNGIILRVNFTFFYFLIKDLLIYFASQSFTEGGLPPAGSDSQCGQSTGPG